jgi:hypothetical protein
VLFRLPNLDGRSQKPVPEAEPALSAESSANSSLRDSSSVHEETEKLSIRIDSGELGQEQESISESTQHPIAPVAVERRSLISRLMTNAMLLGVIGLGATWVYIVAKNVRSSAPTQVARTSESGNLAKSDESLSKRSTATMEDMVADAERLALNQNGNLPSASSIATEPMASSELPSSSDLMAEATAAVQEVKASVETSGLSANGVETNKAAITGDTVAGLGEVDVADTATVQSDNGSMTNANSAAYLPGETSQSVLNSVNDGEAETGILEVAQSAADLPKAGDFKVTMPAAITKEQTTAIAVSNRSAVNDKSAGDLSMVPPAQSQQADPMTLNDTPQLPAASTDADVSTNQPVQTATPSGLNPPLADDMTAVLAEINAESTVGMKSSDQPRRYSKSPSAVTDWLQYLPPAAR